MITSVYKAEIVLKDENYIKIEWDADIGFGQLSLKYNDNGKYTLDSEYLSIDSILKILKKVEI